MTLERDRKMTDTGASFNRPYKPFGMNVKVPEIGERTLKLAEGTLSGIVGAPVEPLFNFLEENEKVKEEMIHNISHDLKTPIATIKSYSESIKDGIYPYGTLEKSVDVILDNANRLEAKVHNLLYLNQKHCKSFM